MREEGRGEGWGRERRMRGEGGLEEGEEIGVGEGVSGREEECKGGGDGYVWEWGCGGVWVCGWLGVCVCACVCVRMCVSAPADV